MTAPNPAPAEPQTLSPVAARLLARARREMSEDRAADAKRTFASVLALAPGNFDALRSMGDAAQRCGDHATAVECYLRVLSTWPDDSTLHVQLGIAQFLTGDTAAGVARLQRACELTPDSAAAWFNLGEALKQLARADEAAEALQRAVGLDPAHIPARLALAADYAGLGRIDVAVREFREVLRRDHANAGAWFGLANLNTLRFDADDMERIRQAFSGAIAGTEAHDQLGFTLAKALEDQGEYARAFEIFRIVNASRRKQVKWDAAGERKRVDAILRVCADWMPPRQAQEIGHEAIHIVSIPRSGSSLVEQILASHPEVEGANEIRDMLDIIDSETRRRSDAFPLWLPKASQADWRRLGEEYLKGTARWRKYKPRFTDKNLVGWYLVGATLAMLPASRVVIVRRDPLETCLACYRQWFSGDSGFAYDLDEMVDYCIDFMRLTRFWTRKFPERVFDLQYETLVAEPETTIRRLLDFCGLPFDRACLEFHRTERVVQSAPSAAQVRTPMRRDTARAARYGEKLDHLRSRLRDAGLLADGH